MPYVKQDDRDRLRMGLSMLNLELGVLCRGNPMGMWGYFRYVSLALIREASLNAAMQYQGKRELRYWLVVDQAGIAANIGNELYDKVLALDTEPWMQVFVPAEETYWPEIPGNAHFLDSFVSIVANKIAEIAGPQGYNYDGAYCGFVNYSLSELLPSVMAALFDSINAKIQWQDVRSLVRFWFSIARELYESNAREYEDRQIEMNGDIEAYKLLLGRLRSVV